MPREKKVGVKKSYYIEKKLADKLKKFCINTGRTETRVIELAIQDYLDKNAKENK